MFFACSICAKTLWDGFFLRISEVSGLLAALFCAVSGMACFRVVQPILSRKVSYGRHSTIPHLWDKYEHARMSPRCIRRPVRERDGENASTLFPRPDAVLTQYVDFPARFLRADGRGPQALGLFLAHVRHPHHVPDDADNDSGSEADQPRHGLLIEADAGTTYHPGDSTLSLPVLCTFCVLWSLCLLFGPVFMMQVSK